jgi:hypothetical protein
MMPNPAKPLERKRSLGNPGRRPLPDAGTILAVPGGRVEPVRGLGVAGMQLWDAVFSAGELWVSSRTDVTLLQLVCEQLDRREVLRDAFVADPGERSLSMSLIEVEKAIASNLGLLGFTPSDRARLGLAEVKVQSKLEAMMEKRANR